jgi:hypothetical protein
MRASKKLGAMGAARRQNEGRAPLRSAWEVFREWQDQGLRCRWGLSVCVYACAWEWGGVGGGEHGPKSGVAAKVRGGLEAS